MSNSITEIYKIIKPDIENRISEFKQIWNNGDEKKLFTELAFCLLTPQSKARNAWRAIESLLADNILFSGTSNDIVPYLNIVRFKNNKANYIVHARELLTEKNKLTLREKLDKAGDIYKKRDWLIINIKGMGYKESSHFLRNIGFVEDITILDRHILKNLKLNGVIEEIPKTLSPKIYLDIEDKMKKYSAKINIPIEHLDLILWYKEAGEIFK